MNLRGHLQQELQRRRAKNPRYSLRALGRHLGVHHSSLSRLIAARCGASEQTVRRVGQRLGLSELTISTLIAAEVEQGVLKAVARPEFVPTTRHLASVTGAPLDAVNIALQSLLRARTLSMRSCTAWSIGEEGT